jgi:hypothetical protein
MDMQSNFAFVYDVILDENNSKAKDASYIGGIVFRMQGDTTTTDGDLSVAFPFDKHQKDLPTKNEKVEIYQAFTGTQKAGLYYYRRIGYDFNNSHNADPNAIPSFFKVRENNETSDNKSEQYKRVEETGIERAKNNDSNEHYGFGEYFQPTLVHTLKLYEGDSIFESRFGQSIRWSGYNNPDKKFAPTIILRNLANPNNIQTTSITGSVEEDINRDGSIIALTSNEYQLPFIPGTVDNKGTGNFETKPASFQNYPDKLTGDQILINSGRIILSAKNAEMMFYSKKNYGFVSDGALSIDNKLGIDISVGDDINVITNGRNVTFHTDNGGIFLGNTDLEPMIKGKKLVDWLGELLDAVVAQQYLTPSGPSKIGPENVAKFNSLKSKLADLTSKKNQLS